MCNITVKLMSNDTEELIKDVTQIEFCTSDILISTFFEQDRALSGYKPVLIDFLQGLVVLERQTSPGQLGII
jgi:hypothetical protein